LSTVPTSSSSSTFSSTSTTSSALPTYTLPGTYRIINLASNTAVDLYNGNPNNGTQVNGW
jgi:hypothetical protein